MSESPKPSMATLTAESIMTTDVVSVYLNMTVREAIQLLTFHRISGAPVVDGLFKVLSVVSEGDLLKLAASVGLDKRMAGCMDKLVKTEKVVTAKKTDGFKDLYRLFLTYPIHRIIIVDASGKLHGIVTRSNILRVLTEASSPSPQE